MNLNPIRWLKKLKPNLAIRSWAALCIFTAVVAGVLSFLVGYYSTTMEYNRLQKKLESKPTIAVVVVQCKTPKAVAIFSQSGGLVWAGRWIDLITIPKQYKIQKKFSAAVKKEVFLGCGT